MNTRYAYKATQGQRTAVKARNLASRRNEFLFLSLMFFSAAICVAVCLW